MTNKQNWIREHRTQITAAMRNERIRGPINDDDRADFLANNETWYWIATNDGVTI